MRFLIKSRLRILILEYEKFNLHVLFSYIRIFFSALPQGLSLQLIFQKENLQKGRYVSFKNHFSSSAFSMENPTQKGEGLITHAEAMKVTDVDYQAILKNNDEIQMSSIRKIIKELKKQEKKQLSSYNENPNKDSVEIITTTGRVYRGRKIRL